VALILLIVGFKGCLDARKDRALKDYVRNVRSLVDQSNGQGQDAFTTLQESTKNASDVDRENSLRGLRLQASQLVDRARSLDHPGEVAQAQRFLIEMLEFRRDGLGAIGDILPTALTGQQRRQGVDRIAAQMQYFLVSDVIFRTRVLPNLRQPLKERGLLNEVQLPDGRFLPDIQWLDPATVATRLRGGTGTANRQATPGVHGTGLGTVSLGGQALAQGGSATVKLSRDLAFSIQVVNQGQSEETDVRVKVTVGRGADAIQLEDSINRIAQGATQTVTIPLDKSPPTGQTVPISVVVEAVPGEKKTDNNKLQASAIFTR
jgi:hypothetical protein